MRKNAAENIKRLENALPSRPEKEEDCSHGEREIKR
jgi:hypothetical protein